MTESAAVRCIHCGKEGTHRVCDECFKATASATQQNPGIERDMTAVWHHEVRSKLILGLTYDDACAIQHALELALTTGNVAPSYVDAVGALNQLLWKRIRIIRRAVEEQL